MFAGIWYQALLFNLLSAISTKLFSFFSQNYLVRGIGKEKVEDWQGMAS